MPKLPASATLNIFLERLLQLYVFLLPWQAVYIFDEKFWNGIKWQYGAGLIYATEIILWLIFITFLMASKKSKPLPSWTQIRTKLTAPDYKTLTVLALWGLIAWSGLSIFWSADKSAGFYLWFKLLEAIGLFFVIVNSNIKPAKLLWPLALSATTQGLIASWQFASQTINASTLLGIASHYAGNYGGIVIETASGRWLRAYGTFGHPNLLGGFCAVGLIAILILSQNKKQLFFLGSLAIISTSGLFFSFSRSAWLATLAMIIFLALITLASKQSKRFFITLIPIIITAITLIFLFYPLLFTRTDFHNRLEKQSILQRLTQAEQARQIILEKPLLGRGLSNYTRHLRELNQKTPAYDLQPVHNIYLLTTAELGIIGLLLFLIIIGLTISSSIKLNNLIYLSLPLTLFGIGFFDHYLATQYAGLMLFWLSLTFVYSNDRIKKIIEP